MWLQLISKHWFSSALKLALGLIAVSAFGCPAPIEAAPKQSQASAAISAAALYRLSLLADDRYSYTGRRFITTWREDGVVLASAMLFRHMTPALDSTTYTAPSSARGRVILEHRRSRQLWTYIPQRNVIVHSVQPQTPAKATQPATLAALMKNYALTVDPAAVSIAGRKAYAVTVRSKRPNKPFNRLWIDPYTGIVLRREIYHSDSTLSSVTYFSDIRLAPSLSTAEFSPWQWSARRPRLVEAHSSGDLAETGTDLGHLPSGYAGRALTPKALDGYFLQSSTVLHGKSQTALHLLYTDGLNQVSVYESLTPRLLDDKDGKPQTIKINALQSARVQHAYSYTVLTWDANGVQYTAMADLNLATLTHFASAFLQTRAS